MYLVALTESLVEEASDGLVLEMQLPNACPKLFSQPCTEMFLQRGDSRMGMGQETKFFIPKPPCLSHLKQLL